MRKLLPLLLFAITLSVVSLAQIGPIIGPTNVCVGSSVTLYDSTGGSWSSGSTSVGTWSSSNVAICTVGVGSGVVYGVSPGVDTIRYFSGGSSVFVTFTVNPAPAAITGTSSFCIGATSTLSDASPGGTWTSSNTSIATVSTGGVVSGASGGSAIISYSTGGVCSATIYVLINTTPTGVISGPTNVCAGGGTIALTDAPGGGSWSSSSTSIIGGGTWSSSSPGIATVGVTSGIVTGVTTGTTTITYTVSGICGTAYTTTTINVINTTSPGTISGTSTVNSGGATITLNETVSGGTWSSGSPGVATINASTGVVTGVSVGTSVITYTISGCGGVATATYTITVTAINGISGHIYFSGAAYSGQVKVWLITYNPITLDLEAIDSAHYSGSSIAGIYYQFLSDPTDSYRVKAAAEYSPSITTGYIPTYHTSSFYWYLANVINHVSGTADINEDINMAYGTVTSGPGFIGGNVTTGANRGTSAGIPVIGMNINVFNSSDQLMQSTITDTSGNYSFSGLPVGTYYVFPDSLNYLTTAYTGINITTGAATMSTADFIQHTISKKITPVTTGVNNVSTNISTVFAFPNPANGKLNIQWSEQTTEKGSVTIVDITGRELYKTVINMNEGTGVKQIDLSKFTNGLYLISVKSGTINYNSRIQIQH